MHSSWKKKSAKSFCGLHVVILYTFSLIPWYDLTHLYVVCVPQCWFQPTFYSYLHQQVPMLSESDTPIGLNSPQFLFMGARLARFTTGFSVCVWQNISQVTSTAGLWEMWSHRVDNSTVVVPFLLCITYPPHTNTYAQQSSNQHTAPVN